MEEPIETNPTIQHSSYSEEVYLGDVITSCRHTLISDISPEEVMKFMEGYKEDNTFKKVIMELRSGDPKRPEEMLVKTPFWESDLRLLFFEDWNGNNRLCIPEVLRVQIMAECHNELTEAAHAGYHHTYNKLASVYYWPHMS